ncbi:MAG: YlcI/YnfO family protein [Rhizobium sp.]|uniref:YlcI/YnfO family protein n=1 Tax=Rhizobium sp. TaxID=391 RepID=UPI0030F0BF61
MKAASLPSLRVDPELRAAAEDVLEEGETLSAFVESAVKRQINFRRTRAEFITRGLASLEEAKQTGIYYGAGEVLGELNDMRKSAGKVAPRELSGQVYRTVEK